MLKDANRHRTTDHETPSPSPNFHSSTVHRTRSRPVGSDGIFRRERGTGFCRLICLGVAVERAVVAAGGNFEGNAGGSPEVADREVEGRQRLQETGAGERGFNSAQSAGSAAGDDWAVAQRSGALADYVQVVSKFGRAV